MKHQNQLYNTILSLSLPQKIASICHLDEGEIASRDSDYVISPSSK